MRTLEVHEREQTAYKALVEHYTERLAKLRVQLEGDLDESQTAKVRILIRECKSFLALGTADTIGKTDNHGAGPDYV